MNDVASKIMFNARLFEFDGTLKDTETLAILFFMSSFCFNYEHIEITDIAN